jgi:DNA-binding MarR family transcriptional regulator
VSEFFSPLTEAEFRAWRGIPALNALLLRRLGGHLQEDSGLSAADFEVMVHLHWSEDEGGIRVLELADAMNWEKSRLSKHLSRMAERNLVSRRPCPSDQRGSIVALTDTGRRQFSEARPVHLARVRELFIGALTPDQIEAMGDIADAVLNHLAAIDGRSGA